MTRCRDHSAGFQNLVSSGFPVQHPFLGTAAGSGPATYSVPRASHSGVPVVAEKGTGRFTLTEVSVYRDLWDKAVDPGMCVVTGPS